MYQLMRAKCLCCHKFKISRLKVKKLLATLALLDAGMLLTAKELDNLGTVRVGGALRAASAAAESERKTPAKAKVEGKLQTKGKRRRDEDDEIENSDMQQKSAKKQKTEGKVSDFALETLSEDQVLDRLGESCCARARCWLALITMPHLVRRVP